MTVKGIIAISGKSGLFKVVAQGKNNVIVESLDDKKRFPAYATDRISALEDISIYTYSDDKALIEVFEAIFDKENGGEAVSHKEDPAKLAAYLEEILPDYDQERVYPSDIKKIFMWYNLLVKAGELKKEESEEKVEETKAEEVKEEKPKAAKKPAAKKTTAKPKADADKPAAKKPAAKKAAPKKEASKEK
ncbi:MAG: DUF5606 domain-containing protein [Crocinitomicaceae bacterium]|jgi:hypothetical protein|nr:DUF5606 domain-containing protein [Crocinitomicaceae bacterium]